ncbi:antiviral reverse transcriptase Drt3b [Leifsonia sp. 1010]|uniref:antiviral reverse transcriptase Drt3b n=1 Tax=Leifsonia sp. 1010 TaxID=2817769 RepID=UPI00286303E9|nr:antiviral reverse transcriptase Drt3b [Leifsonia sp. 1010]MDR6612262.1 hypothetical protein [Leifsonia sp. 1010]
MHKRKRSIRKRDARVLLSDVLPYELPPSFNNRGLYTFINDSRLRIEGDRILARRLDDATPGIVSILLGRKVTFPTNAGAGEDSELQFDGPARIPTIPFQFNVRHRANDFRTLTVPHPAAQIEVVDFYRSNSDMMLFHTGRSPFSLRHPSRVARYSVVRDWLFEASRKKPDGVEDERYEYEWIRSYFAYRRYSNVYKFYDSSEYRSCERRYGFLVKADIAKCFDSIYTHSVAWAAHGHNVVKDNLGKKNLKNTFGDDFDTLMQRLNHNETSGITIGSEVSRIFAEVILQAVDRDIHAALEDEGLRQGHDYQILRYVDDYFIFLANAQNRLDVLEQISKSLRKYKLHLNAAKEEGEHTPWLSPLTVAKDKVTRLLKRSIDRGENADEPDGDRLPRPYVRSERLVTGYKAILLDTGVSHFDLANYALARTERAMEKLMQSSLDAIAPYVDSLGGEIQAHTHATTGALISILDFAFFAFSGAPRMSPAVKIARIVSSALRYSRSPHVPIHERQRLEMRIREELAMHLARAGRSESPSAVTATLVDCLSDLGEQYRLHEDELAEIFRFACLEDGRLHAPKNLDAVLLFSLLLHIRSYGGYRALRRACIDWLKTIASRSLRDGERALVTLNVLSCPFVDRATKVHLLRDLGITRPQEVTAISSPRRHWNVNWESFDLYAALQEKRLYEVY